jgi:DNA-directed RNA polymerase subunit RPC12/RpoP
MFDFCQNCGASIGQNQVEGQFMTCRECGARIGFVEVPKKIVVDGTQREIDQGNAARCPVCQQAVALKATGSHKAFVPHFTTGGPRKMCPSSGKPVSSTPAIPATPSPIQRPKTSKDLSKFYTRECVRVILLRRTGDPTIEELNLEYLDKTARVRTQVEALKDILGPAFQLRAYPTALNRPHLAVWGNAEGCVIARKHPQGGFEPMPDEELLAVAKEAARERRALFAG